MDLVRALPNPAALWHRLTQRSNSNFKFAFLFLGPEQRDGLQQVYEFCRVVDDIVDERAPGQVRVKRSVAEYEKSYRIGLGDMTAMSGGYSEILKLEARYGRSVEAAMKINNVETLTADIEGHRVLIEDRAGSAVARTLLTLQDDPSQPCAAADAIATARLAEVEQRLLVQPRERHGCARLVDRGSRRR